LQIGRNNEENGGQRSAGFRGGKFYMMKFLQ